MNRATRIVVGVLGILLAVAGIDHGLFETLQGNAPTTGLFIQAIGPAQRMWIYGTEDALTILPNFLVSGIMAISFSVAIAIWSVGFIHRKHGVTVFLLLFVPLFFVGGGVAQVPFFAATWAFSTRINKPLTWWRKVLSERARGVLATIWPVFLTACSFCFLVGIEIAVFGYFPGVPKSDPNALQAICWSFIFGGVTSTFVLSFVCAFARDIQGP